MDLKAIVLVSPATACEPARANRGSFGDVPMAYLDVLGAPVLHRVVERLERVGTSTITLVNGAGGEARPFAARAAQHSGLRMVEAETDFWQAAEDAVEQARQDGAELVLLVHVGAYVEIDYEELIQHHIDKRCRMTAAVSAEGAALDIFVLDASRRNDAIVLLRSQLTKVRDDCERFQVSGYINRLETAVDLRCLALDGLLKKNAVQPIGQELKPGVWAGQGARIHRNARVLAPAFVGAYSKVRASALITRSSVIEHHAEIDCGTVLENSTVLPFTYVGAGLDVMHSVVGFRRLSHLARGVEVEISDTKLVGMSASGVLSRMAGSTAGLFAFLPKQIFRGFFGRSRKGRPAELPESLDEPAAALETEDVKSVGASKEVPDFPSRFAVLRRYGDR